MLMAGEVLPVARSGCDGLEWRIGQVHMRRDVLAVGVGLKGVEAVQLLHELELLPGPDRGRSRLKRCVGLINVRRDVVAVHVRLERDEARARVYDIERLPAL